MPWPCSCRNRWEVVESRSGDGESSPAKALATVKTVSEVHEKKLEEMQVRRSSESLDLSLLSSRVELEPFPLREASYRKQLSMERNSRLQAEVRSE